MLASVYMAQRRYNEAEPIYKRLLAVAEKSLGPDPLSVSNYSHALHDLVKLYQGLGRHDEIEALYARTANLIESKALAPANQKKAELLGAIAVLYNDLGRVAEAVRAVEQQLALLEAGGHQEALSRPLGNLIDLYLLQERAAEAEPLAKRALSIAEANDKPGHEGVIHAAHQLARVYRRQRHYQEAETLYLRALEMAEAEYTKRTALKNGSGLSWLTYMRSIGTILNNLGLLYEEQEQYGQAEKSYKRALEFATGEIFEPDRDHIITSLHNLGRLYQEQGRYAEAEPLLKSALEVAEADKGTRHPDAAYILSDFALVREGQRRYAEAEELQKRALAIMEQAFGPKHPILATSLNNLSGSLMALDRYAEAEPLLKRALAINEAAFGPEHPQVALILNSLGSVYIDQNRDAEAEAVARRVLAIVEKTLGAEHSWWARSITKLAHIHAMHGDWVEAARLHRRAVSAIVASSAKEAAGGRSDLVKVVLASNTYNLRAAARAVYRAAPGDAAALAEGFELAQWAVQTSAAEALNQMALRFAKGGGQLADLVRRRQDLLLRREAEGKRLFTVFGAGDLASELHRSLAKLDADLAALDTRLARDFPEYAALARPKPLSLAEAQALLAPNEALVAFLDIPRMGGRLSEETLIFAVTRDEAGWLSVPQGTAALKELVEKLRCGLDASAWTDPTNWEENNEAQKAQKLAQAERRNTCQRLLGFDATDSEPPPFDLGAAHEMYQALFAPIETTIAGKRLLVVAPGALARLPLTVLIDKPAPTRIARAAEDFKGVSWLGARYPMTVLPAVSSLAALRKLAKAGPSAPEPYLGIGNPLLDGGNPASVIAGQARAKQTCPKAVAPPPRQLAFSRAPYLLSGLGFRQGVANASAIGALTPLPETADELCAIAHTLDAPGSAVLLGAKATETAVKAKSRAGELARARVVHFATHGLLAAESEAYLKAGAEPGLILTPPAAASEEDDGLLAASEVAQLALNADWVVLSACNTAGGEKSNPDSLSGLARAFFYAGAKALLVSHWAVDSDAAVKLTTRTFAEERAHPELGRAEAFRRAAVAMQSDVTRPADWTPAAHPAVWAPFVVVGEG